MLLPAARGPRSAALVAALRDGDPAALEIARDASAQDPLADPLADDDLQLALWICYELHYQGFADVDDDWEWRPDLIALRSGWERDVLAALDTATRSRVGAGLADGRGSGESLASRLQHMVESDDGPGLARYLERRAGWEQAREFLIHRSVYQLMEADPHTWVIPRLRDDAKTALIEIQFDEYGAGRRGAMHSQLYRRLLRSLDMNDEYGGYLEQVPGITLALGNVMSLFALHRRWRGALAGHLAAFEMTSSIPCRRYGRGLRRLGVDDDACAFFDVHITADALHEQVAAHDLCGSMAAAEPEIAEDILFGAASALHVDNMFASHLLSSWESRRSSLVAAAVTTS